VTLCEIDLSLNWGVEWDVNITNFETNSENLALIIMHRKFVGEGVVH